MIWIRLFLACWLAAVPFQSLADDASGWRHATAASPAESRPEGYLSHAREIVMYAMGFLGVSYKFGGNSPDTGFDCSGLVRHVFNQVVGLVLPHDAREMSRMGERITVDELQPGDLVFYNTLRRPFSHVGIYLGDQRFIHAPSYGGEVEIVDMSHRYWRNRFNGVRRISF